MRFDAYAGNVSKVPPSEVAEMISFSVSCRVARGRPRGRYTDVWDVKDGSDSCGWVALDEHLETAYFEFKGERTPDAAACIRRHWGESHTVSRMDACEDYNEPGAFVQIVRLLDQAKDPRVQSLAMTPRDGDRGETIYWGSPQSRVRVRCYEAGKMKERLHLGKPNWARAEAQIRPGKAKEKLLAAKVSPLDAWGFAAWSQLAAELLSRTEVQRFAPESTPPTYHGTTLYIARAHRRHLEEMLADHGSGECVFREFQAIWAGDDLAKKHLKN